MTTRVNMAAVAARMAADETSLYEGVAGSERERGALEFDAGELRSRDLALSPQRAAADTDEPASSSSAVSLVSPSKLQQKLLTAQRLDAKASPLPSSSPAHVLATEARRKMLDLKASVVNALDVLSAQRDDGRHRIRMFVDGTARNNAEALETLALFDANYVHLDTVGYDVAKVMAKADTQLRVPYFDSFGLPVRVPTEDTIEARLAQATRLLSDVENAQLCHSLRKDITRLLFPLDDKGLPELICAVNKFTKTDVFKTVSEALAKHSGSLAAIEASLNELEASIAAARAKEDFAEVERLTARLIDLSGRRADIRAVQVSLLAGDAVDDANTTAERANATSAKGPAGTATTSVAGFVKALDSLMYGSAIPTLRTEKQELLATAKADIAKLSVQHAHALRANDFDTARYNKAASESRQRLQANHAQQQAVWEQVMGLLDTLEAVGGEHEAIMKEHCKTTEAEQLRRKNLREYLDSYRRHTVCLEELVRNSEVGISFLDTLSARFKEARLEVESSGVEDKLQALLSEQRRAYLEAFSYFGKGCNAHIARFDQRVLNCEHMLKELEFAYQQAPAVGDADKNVYAQRVRTIDRQRRAASDKVEEFSGAYRVREDQFVDVAVRVQMAQRSRADKLRGLGDGGAPEVDGASEEGELLASLRGTRASALLSHLDKITAMASRHSSFVEVIREQHSRLEQELSPKQKGDKPSDENPTSLQ